MPLFFILVFTAGIEGIEHSGLRSSTICENGGSNSPGPVDWSGRFDVFHGEGRRDRLPLKHLALPELPLRAVILFNSIVSLLFQAR